MRALLRSLQWRRQRQALGQIELLVMDVDGVLTDGGLWFDPNGLLQKRFDVRDGLGIRLLQQAGLQNTSAYALIQRACRHGRT